MVGLDANATNGSVRSSVRQSVGSSLSREPLKISKMLTE